ncbi:MAG: PLD nuclease N-terminal domain-containing protein [Actinomycetota bacterium]|nr:PLD nuclease N-terminal domain-containing protein [Actinomycetota bacterium]
MQELLNLPTPALVAIVVLGTAQIALELYAVIDIVRRPADQIAGTKVMWILIVVFVNLIGAIVYLLVGRKPATVTQSEAAVAQGDAARTAVDTLYGGDDR